MVLTSTLTDIGFVDAAVVALLGYAVVFFGLVLLMCVVIIMGKVFIAKEKKVAAHSDAAKAAIAAVPEAPAADAPAAPGTAGKLKLYDVEPKTAASQCRFPRRTENRRYAYGHRGRQDGQAPERAALHFH